MFFEISLYYFYGIFFKLFKEIIINIIIMNDIEEPKNEIIRNEVVVNEKPRKNGYSKYEIGFGVIFVCALLFLAFNAYTGLFF